MYLQAACDPSCWRYWTRWLPLWSAACFGNQWVSPPLVHCFAPEQMNLCWKAMLKSSCDKQEHPRKWFLNPAHHPISAEDVFFCQLSGKVPPSLCFTRGPCHINSCLLLLCFLIPFIALPLFTLCSLSERSCLCPRQLPPLLVSSEHLFD